MFRYAWWFAAAVAAAAQVYAPEVRTIRSEVDDSDQPYALYVPRSFDPAKKYPLVVSLHGEGTDHRLDMLRVFGRANPVMEAGRRFAPLPPVDFIVACPFARGNMDYRGIAESEVYGVVADVKRRFPIDEDRVYLTGTSTGGGGALWLALTRPDVWAAVAAVCPAPAPAAEDLAGNALNLQVHLFHGDQDLAVPVSVSRRWQKMLLEAGANAAYTEYPGVRHNAWDSAYRNGAIFEWFARFHRQSRPERVRFRSSSYRYGEAYWVKLDELTPGIPASIDARFAAGNRIEVNTANLDAFTLRLDGHPRFAPGLAVTVVIDGTALRVKPAPAVSFHRAASRWQTGLGQPAPGGKRAGAEGPIAAALDARHIYVYGTADAPEDDERNRRREVARQASQWSSQRAPLPISFAVKADRDVSAADMANSNLVLFGTRETNSMVARLADRLPLALNPGAADYGLVFVAPLDGGRYAVINSGLPWWTGADQTGRVRGPVPPYRVLETFPDFLLFKGSLANVVAEGLFDTFWKLPASAAAKMRATGTVR